VLSDEKRRSEYDAFRKGGFGGGGYGGGFSGAQGFDFEEILKRFQGSRGGSYRTGRGRTMEGSFDDIFDMFAHMGGGGGAQYYSTGDDYGSFRSPSERTDINANLTISASTAKNGGDVLFRHNDKKITLKIKPGTVTGQKLRIRDQGKVCSCCGHAGDLIVIIRVER